MHNTHALLKATYALVACRTQALAHIQDTLSRLGPTRPREAGATAGGAAEASEAAAAVQELGGRLEQMQASIQLLLYRSELAVKQVRQRVVGSAREVQAQHARRSPSEPASKAVPWLLAACSMLYAGALCRAGH